MIFQIALALTMLVISAYLLNWLDYKFMKNRYLKSGKFDLNVCCGETFCDGVNADVVRRDVPNFRLVRNIYKLPFRDRQFKNAVCSHTMEHVEHPVKFFKELKRVSENVTVLVPPLWDFGCMANLLEHKWQFLTLRSRHRNSLPNFFRIPLSRSVQNFFGQKIS